MKASNNKLVALAFKTMTHKNLGPLTYLRVYSGSIKAGVPFFNANRQEKEEVSKILRV